MKTLLLDDLERMETPDDFRRWFDACQLRGDFGSRQASRAEGFRRVIRVAVEKLEKTGLSGGAVYGLLKSVENM